MNSKEGIKSANGEMIGLICKIIHQNMKTGSLALQAWRGTWEGLQFNFSIWELIYRPQTQSLQVQMGKAEN